ncbi:MAG: AarF/ABC1/UbiB kinase family protein [Chloroflexi bacterium]|nr:AarF/ABC1/UbiB kinase family protein [Chloroflexota bacterium]
MLEFRRRYRNLGRYREIVGVLVRHGFLNVVEQLGIAGYAPWPLRLVTGYAVSDRLSTEARVRQAIEELGPTFVKIGQILSTRPDLIPPALLSELAKLQDAVAPAPWDSVRACVERELGAPIPEVFSSFDEEPIAAASLGQVHAATLRSGEEVVVKVQRPGIEDTIAADLDILGDLAALARERTRWGQVYDFSAIAEDFAYTLRMELDYVREGRNAERFRAYFAEDPAVRIPKVFWAYTTRRVLTLERLRGVRIDDLDALDRAGVDRQALAEEAARIVIREVFDLGCFHADPHPGNFFILDDGAIGAMDFGMVGYMNPADQIALARLFVSTVRRDTAAVVDELIRMEAVGYGANRVALQRDLDRLVHKYQDVRLGEMRVSELWDDILPMVFRHRVRLPSEYWLLAKALVMMEGLGAKLAPDFSILTVAEPYVRDLAARLVSPTAIFTRATSGFQEWLELLLYLPTHAPRLLDRLERGDLRLGVRLDDVRESLQRVDRTMTRLSASVVVGALVVASAILGAAALWEQARVWAAVASGLAMLLAIALGLWLAYASWRAGRR